MVLRCKDVITTWDWLFRFRNIAQLDVLVWFETNSGLFSVLSLLLDVSSTSTIRIYKPSMDAVVIGRVRFEKKHLLYGTFKLKLL